MHRAVFLDRDGVLVEDSGLIVSASELRILPGAPAALARLEAAGFLLVVITNQGIVGRGMITPEGLDALHRTLEEMLRREGAPPLDGIYSCPHHPKATIDAYRVECRCRKPRPGLLERAAADLAIDLLGSFMVGDRPSDIAAGRAAGCRTVRVETGCHDEPPITSPDPIDPAIEADFRCPDLAAAAEWILGQDREPGTP